MTLLPILGRELLSRSRNRSTYWARFAVASVGVLVCLESLGTAPSGAPSRLGSFVFSAVVACAFLVSCSVCLLAADAISLERREGTLGLLFLTRVKALDVLLGKLGSVGIISLGALVSFLPVLMIPLLAGGVTGGEATRKALALLNTLFFALVSGLSASATQHVRFRAVRSAVLLLAGIMILPFLPYWIGFGGPLHLLAAFSPLVSVISAGEGHYTNSRAFYWTSLLAVHVLAWLLLLNAAFRLRRYPGDQVGAAASSRARMGSDAKRSEKEVGLGSWQPVKGESSPIEWLVFRQSGVGAVMWAVALLALAYEGWVPLARLTSGGGPSISWFFAGAFGVVGAFCGGTVVAWVASRFFVGIRRTGELELLMTTPLGVETIVSEQWNVLKRFFAWPVLVMQAPMIPQILATMQAPSAALPPSWQTQMTLFKVLVVANTFLGACALCWVGLWFGLRARSQAGAIVWTVGLAKGIPAQVRLICSVTGTVLASAPGTFSGAILYGSLAWISELAIFLYLLSMIGLARRRLIGELAGIESPAFHFRESLLAALYGLKTRSW
jgi:hypothetical protein